jgi:hypothetical protein
MAEELSDNDELSSRLLETFPVSKYELETLLELEKFYRNNEEFCFSDWLLTRGDEEHTTAVRRVETSLLPKKFVSCTLKSALEQVFVMGCQEGDENYETFRFLEAMVCLLGRRGPRSSIHVLVHACSDDVEPNAVAFQLCIYQLALASHVLYTGDSNLALDRRLAAPSSWVKDPSCSISDWAAKIAPQSYAALYTFVHIAIFSDESSFHPSIPPLMLPCLDKRSSLVWADSDACSGLKMAVTLALMSPNLGGTWRRLYSTDEDACSFRTMQMSLIAYKGPTVILIRTTEGDVFGYSTNCPWKKSSKWYGEGYDSFIFTLFPKAAVYPSTGQGKHHQYMNLPPEHRPQDLKGLCIGGISHDRPRIHITESMEECRVSAVDVTYPSGPILSDDMQAFFDVDSLEVWATSIDSASFEAHSRKGKLQADIHEATRRKNATVDKKQFVDDFATGAFMNKAFAHRNDIDDGRHELSIREFKESLDKANESQHGTKTPTSRN